MQRPRKSPGADGPASTAGNLLLNGVKVHVSRLLRAELAKQSLLFVGKSYSSDEE